MYRAYWQFYKTIVPFISVFAIICSLFGGLLWASLLFLIIGPFIGMLGFNVFYKNQFYFYFNLGITKTSLLKTSFIINFLIGIPVLGLLFLIFNLFLGIYTTL